MNPRRHTLLACALLLLAFLAGNAAAQDWTTSRADMQNTGALSNSLGEFKGISWTTEIPCPVSSHDTRTTKSDPIPTSSRVILACVPSSYDNADPDSGGVRVYGLDAESGDIVLNDTVVEGAPLGDTPAYVDSALYIPVDGKGLLKYNLESQDKSWLVETEKQYPQTPTVTDDAIYFLTAHGTAAVERSTEQTKWNRIGDYSGWGSNQYSPLVVAGNVVIRDPQDDRRIVALDKETGEPIWEKNMEEYPKGLGAVEGDIILSSDGGLQSVAASDGSLNWRATYAAGNPFSIWGGTIFLSTGGGVRTIDVSNGARDWERTYDTTHRGEVAIASGLVATSFSKSHSGFSHSRVPGVYGLNSSGGDIEWGFPAETAGPPSIGEGYVTYWGGTDNHNRIEFEALDLGIGGGKLGNISVTNFTIVPKKTTVNGSLTPRLELSNTGGARAMFEATLRWPNKEDSYDDYQPEKNPRTGVLQTGESTTILFPSYTPPEEGLYEFTVETEGGESANATACVMEDDSNESVCDQPPAFARDEEEDSTSTDGNGSEGRVIGEPGGNGTDEDDGPYDNASGNGTAGDGLDNGTSGGEDDSSGRQLPGGVDSVPNPGLVLSLLVLAVCARLATAGEG